MPLKRIPRSISPKLLAVLAKMGHGDELLICDANFPSHAQNVKHIVHADASSATDILSDVLQLLPLDSFVPFQASIMKQVDSDLDAPIVADFERILNKSYQTQDRSPVPVKIERVERFDFYARAKLVFAICVSGESRLYGNIIIKKGVIDLNGNTVVTASKMANKRAGAAEKKKIQSASTTLESLMNNQIGDNGCRALTKAAFHNINHVLETLIIDNWEVEDVRSDRRVLMTLFALLSAREVCRIGNNNNMVIKRLPSELIRVLAGMVRIEQRDNNILK